MKSFLQNDNREMYSVDNERNSVVTKRFIRILRNKTYKYMTSTSENVYIDKLDEIVNQYNNTFHRTTKMMPVDVNPRMHIDFNKENNKGCCKFEIVDNVRISKYKNIFGKGYLT